MGKLSINDGFSGKPRLIPTGELDRTTYPPHQSCNDLRHIQVGAGKNS